MIGTKPALPNVSYMRPLCTIYKKLKIITVEIPLTKSNYKHKNNAFLEGQIPAFISLEEVNAFIPELTSNMNNSGNRNFVINSAIIIEFLINNLLRILLPKYKDLDENLNFTFSLKIELLKSFNMINPNIIMRANIIREVRNLYAHNIEFESIISLKQKYQSKISTGYYSFNKDLNKENKMPKEKDLDNQFRQLFLGLVIELKSIEASMRIYRKVIDSEFFLAKYQNELKQ